MTQEQLQEVVVIKLPIKYIDIILRALAKVGLIYLAAAHTDLSYADLAQLSKTLNSSVTDHMETKTSRNNISGEQMEQADLTPNSSNPTE